MRKTILLLTILFVTLILNSCEDKLVDSCYDINIVSKNIDNKATKVGAKTNISIKFNNNCGNEIRVWDAKLEGKDEIDFYTQEINSNTIIPKSGLIFNLVFQPKSEGSKEVSLVIKHDDLGSSTLNLNLKAI